jgi:hypothetical protein
MSQARPRAAAAWQRATCRGTRSSRAPIQHAADIVTPPPLPPPRSQGGRAPLTRRYAVLKELPAEYGVWGSTCVRRLGASPRRRRPRKNPQVTRTATATAARPARSQLASANARRYVCARLCVTGVLAPRRLGPVTNTGWRGSIVDGMRLQPGRGGGPGRRLGRAASSSALVSGKTTCGGRHDLGSRLDGRGQVGERRARSWARPGCGSRGSLFGWARGGPVKAGPGGHTHAHVHARARQPCQITCLECLVPCIGCAGGLPNNISLSSADLCDRESRSMSQYPTGRTVARTRHAEKAFRAVKKQIG